jgi:hypothetical protein
MLSLNGSNGKVGWVQKLKRIEMDGNAVKFSVMPFAFISKALTFIFDQKYVNPDDNIFNYQSG